MMSWQYHQSASFLVVGVADGFHKHLETVERLPLWVGGFPYFPAEDGGYQPNHVSNRKP